MKKEQISKIFLMLSFAVLRWLSSFKFVYFFRISFAPSHVF